MKLLKIVMAGIALTVISVSSVSAQLASINIDQIIANENITGYVRGLDQNDTSNHKVIVYVHTDQWYIHPYAGQGEGLSWAPIKGDGTWEIQTVQRQFKADKVAALIVKKAYPEPSRVEDLGKIKYEAIVVKELSGTPEYGRL